MRITKEKLKTILTLSVAFGTLSLGAWVIQKYLGQENPALAGLTERLGIAGPIFLILGVAFGGIFVPMTSLPFVFIGLSQYGFWETFLIWYLGNSIIAPVADFYIARRWGRGVVAKLAGKRALAEIDKFAAVAGYKALIVVRFFGGVLFDSVSYAVGLTKLNFKKVMVITALVPIPSQVLTLLIINRSIEVSPFYMGLIVAIGYLGAFITGAVIYKSAKKEPKGESA